MKTRDRIDTAIRLILITITCVIIFVPLYLVILNSFKPYPEIAADIGAWPIEPTLENYAEAWRRLNFPNALKNTLIITSSRRSAWSCSPA